MDKCSIVPGKQKRRGDPPTVAVSVIRRTRFECSSAEERGLEPPEGKQARLVGMRPFFQLTSLFMFVGL